MRFLALLISFENLGSKISCYGDSFAFCRQVNDNETWEHYLSKSFHDNVLNFGVGNYGIDQAILRLKRDFPKNPTEIVILCVVPDTIRRILNVWKHYFEYGNTFGFKPRFILDNNELKLIKNPIDENKKFEKYTSTAGRFLLANLLPKNHNIKFSLVDRLLPKKTVSEIIDIVFRFCGQKTTVIFCDRLKDLGFKHAFKAGISFGKDDLVIPESKNQLIEDTKKIILPFFKKQISAKKIDVVVNPEFLQEGFAIRDVLNPHIIVIGADNKKGSKLLEKYYKKFYKSLPEILHVGITTAELIKYANNSFLATKISFINSIANICQQLPDVDVDSIAYAIGKDNRIGPLFLKAGPGFGGSCLPKDLSGLISFSKQIGNTAPFFEAVQKVNKKQPEKIFSIMKKMKILSSKNTISILGLAFKKNTDDIRESVSIKIVEKCLNYGLTVKVHDPMAMKNFQNLFHDKIEYHKSVNSCLKNTDCCIILTDWDEYGKLQSENFSIMNKKNVIDTRRILNYQKLKNVNFYALGLGHPKKSK